MNGAKYREPSEVLMQTVDALKALIREHEIRRDHLKRTLTTSMLDGMFEEARLIEADLLALEAELARLYDELQKLTGTSPEPFHRPPLDAAASTDSHDPVR